MRRIGWQIKTGLKANRSARAAKSVHDIKSHLNVGEWRSLKEWHATASDKAPKPCYDSMKKQTQERVDRYQKVSPPGDLIPINVELFDTEDLVPEDTKLREVVAGLRNGRVGDSRGIKAKHIKV